MTLNQLKYYVEIVKESSFTKAAEKLFVSQSTLSKSVRALEEEFQIKLIHRAAKEFVLTQEGYFFLNMQSGFWAIIRNRQKNCFNACIMLMAS